VVWAFSYSSVYPVSSNLIKLRKRGRKLTRNRALANKNDLAGLRVYINGDGPDVYEDALMRISSAKSDRFAPTLILLAIRLGIDRITPVYREALKSALQMSQSVGIAG
jgi:cysteine protease ATG4